MGRKKKNVELLEVGKVASNVRDFKQESSRKDEDLKANKKKWERLIVNTYKTNIKIDSSELETKLQEKFTSTEEVKNVISELKVKIKDLEYLFKKQWQILKKFNLQESIYREESKNLVDGEKEKKDEIYSEAIQKLTAAHVGGFEPASVIKHKIMTKIQQKFDIPESIIEELRSIDFDHHFRKEAKDNKSEFLNEDKLLSKRHEDQVQVLENFIKVNFLIPGKDQKSRDKDYDSMPNFQQNKQELKRYEKELEMKASKKLHNLLPVEMYESIFNSNEKSSTKPKISLGFPGDDDDEISFQKDELNKQEYCENANTKRFDSGLKIKDFLKVHDSDSITKYKEKVVEEIKERSSSRNGEYLITRYANKNQYKSKILNDLNRKLSVLNKLTDFDIQIMIYLSHVVVRDLVQAKIYNRVYEGMINPEELLDFLKKYKVEIQNGNVKIDGKLIGTVDNNSFVRTNNPGNFSSYSYINSEYSKEEF